MSTTASPPGVDPRDDEHEIDEAPPRLQANWHNLLVFGLFIVLALGCLYFILPQFAGLEDTWQRLDEGSPGWLAAAFAFTLLSFGGYVLLFQGVFARAAGSRIDVRVSYQITMAGLAATRLFAAGGAGGLVLMAWALRQAGMPRRTVADKTLAFLVLTYAVYMLALLIGGVGLRVGLFPGPAPWAMTVLPAIFAGATIVLALVLSAVPTDLQRRLEGHARSHGRLARLAQRFANAPAALSAGIREALEHLRSGDPALLGSLVFWGGSIAVLWASFEAFGDAPPAAVIVVAFFVGMLGNLLPLPAGIGGVDGGMIGAFVAFGVDFGLATVAVLVFRGFTFWLPTLPGAVAYFQLRRTVARWRAERLELVAADPA